MPSPLSRRPQATAFSIEDLLDRVRRGEVRIPEFQRPLHWTVDDVLDLFDSVYRGYPIGTLLFWKREAPAASVTFGPLRIDAPSHDQALWVVDGQQRLTSLAGVLLHPSRAEHEVSDDFTLYFDLESETFTHLAGGEEPPAHWLPLGVVLDSEHLLEWLSSSPDRPRPTEHTRKAIRLGKAIREYQLPVYIVDTPEEQTLKIIFKRLNTAGHPLKQTEVFDALYTGRVGTRTYNIQSISERLGDLNFGAVDTSLLLQAVLAIRGLDFTRDFESQLSEDDDLARTLEASERAIRDTIIFLKRDTGIPHVLLLPQPISFALLARFFHQHREPSARSRELLSRWFWRSSVAELYWGQNAPPIREMLVAISSDEAQSIKALLAQIPPPASVVKAALGPGQATLLQPRDKVRANAMLSLQPRHLFTGELLDQAQLLDQQGLAAFQPLLRQASRPGSSDTIPSGLRRLLDAYLFHPPLPDQQILDALLAEPPPSSSALRSHAITSKALKLLRRTDKLPFIGARMETLDEGLHDFLRVRLRWDEPDRPSLQSMIVPDDED